METAVCFAYRKPESLAKDISLPGRDQLVDILREYDLTPVFSNNAEVSFDEDASAVVTYSFGGSEESEPAARRLTLGQDIAVVLNRRGRSLQLDPETRALVPIVNENEVRSLGHYKIRSHQKLLEPLEIASPTILVASPDEAEVFMRSFPADRYIAKPQIGHGAKNVHPLEAAAVLERIANEPEWQIFAAAGL
jgi:glutathione synthase/RimK-type ligase-like ATP-grasp enzyme